MKYRIILAKGDEAVSVTTQYSPDDGVTWYTDEEALSPAYDLDDIHGDIECGSARYNLESNHTYTLRAILNYRSNGALYREYSNRVTATVENYDPPVLYNDIGHIPEEYRVNWQRAGLLPDYRAGLLPETPDFADHRIDVTSMPGADVDTRIAEALEIARRHWRDYGDTSIIYFPPGTYRVTSPIVLNEGDGNIIFQGAGADGPDPTTLDCHVGKDGTCFDIHGTTSGSPFYALTSDIEKGERVIVGALPLCPPGVDDPSCFNEGDWIHIWEASYPAADSGAVVGQITQLERVIPDFVVKDEASKRYSTSYDLKVQKVRPVTNIGIENLKIYRSDGSKSTENRYGSGNNIKFLYAVNCWVRGVESELTSRHHVTIDLSSHIEISGCYLHRARFYGGNSYGYGVVLGASTTNCLTENNVFRRLRHAMGLGTGTNSNVFTFNYSREQYSTYRVIWDIRYSDSDVCLHGRIPYANLFEHNVVEYIEADDKHGRNGPYNAFVRNRVYEDNIDLHNARHTAVLGCYVKHYTPVTKRGETSFSIEGYGKWVYDRSVSYEDALWISHNLHQVGNPAVLLKDISYFYTSRPYFLSAQYTWPTLGPELENPKLMEQEGTYYRSVSQRIPAQARYQSGYETYISKLTQLVP